MITPKQLKEAKERYYAEVAAYVFANPAITLPEIAERFGLSTATVSRIATRSGLAKRRPGRKPKNGAQA